jgi:DegV family protein with EDD domain
MHIVTDSAADLMPEEAKSLGITVAPLYIQFPEGSIHSDQISADEFYDRLEAMFPEIPTTSQPSSGAFRELYERLAKVKEDILSVHISSGLSGTIESARAGYAQLKDNRAQFVDTLTLSGGERYQVLAAALAAKAGWNKDAIVERLRKIRESTEVVFTLDTLTYLAKGGRIGRVQALAGSLLKLKPLIRVDHNDGKYSTAGKARTLQKALDGISEHLEKMYGTETPMWVSIMHGRFSSQAEALANSLQERLNVARLEVLRISPVLGVHTGPGVVGAAVVPYQLFEDLL